MTGGKALAAHPRLGAAASVTARSTATRRPQTDKLALLPSVKKSRSRWKGNHKNGFPCPARSSAGRPPLTRLGARPRAPAHARSNPHRPRSCPSALGRWQTVRLGLRWTSAHFALEVEGGGGRQDSWAYGSVARAGQQISSVRRFLPPFARERPGFNPPTRSEGAARPTAVGDALGPDIADPNISSFRTVAFLPHFARVSRFHSSGETRRRAQPDIAGPMSRRRRPGARRPSVAAGRESGPAAGRRPGFARVQSVHCRNGRHEPARVNSSLRSTPQHGPARQGNWPTPV